MEDTCIDINPYTLTSYYTEIYADDRKLSNATCFFTRYNGNLFLITNWHVVSGKDADTKKLLDKYGAIPNSLKVYLPEEKDGQGLTFENNRFMTVSLYDEEGEKIWYELKKNERMIDVVAIPVLDEIKEYYLPIEDAEEICNEHTMVEIASEIYIIGFPFGRIGGVIPIWKKASVASEPMVDIDDMPFYYADTATRAGMSGSPVVLFEKRGVFIRSGEKESRHWTKFVGIYSGRIGAYDNETGDAQLGRVWKTDIIKELIESHDIK